MGGGGGGGHEVNSLSALYPILISSNITCRNRIIFPQNFRIGIESFFLILYLCNKTMKFRAKKSGWSWRVRPENKTKYRKTKGKIFFSVKIDFGRKT